MFTVLFIEEVQKEKILTQAQLAVGVDDEKLVATEEIIPLGNLHSFLHQSNFP